MRKQNIFLVLIVVELSILLSLFLLHQSILENSYIENELSKIRYIRAKEYVLIKNSLDEYLQSEIMVDVRQDSDRVIIDFSEKRSYLEHTAPYFATFFYEQNLDSYEAQGLEKVCYSSYNSSVDFFRKIFELELTRTKDYFESNNISYLMLGFMNVDNHTGTLTNFNINFSPDYNDITQGGADFIGDMDSLTINYNLSASFIEGHCLYFPIIVKGDYTMSISSESDILQLFYDGEYTDIPPTKDLVETISVDPGIYSRTFGFCWA